jgi:hypothetical protein
MSDAHAAQVRELSTVLGCLRVLLLALLVTVAMAAPVIVSPSERIFGTGEILSREDPSRDALVVIDQFRTGRVPAPYLQPITDLPGRVLSRLIGPVAAYNFLVLATFPLAATTAYLLARYLFNSHLAALIAGLAYAFLPFHVMQAGGHPHIAQTHWLPLYLLALWAHVERPGVIRAALLLLAAAATGLADFYAGFIIAVMSPLAIVAYGVGAPKRTSEGRERGLVPTTLVLLIGGILGAAAVEYFAPDLITSPASPAFPRSDLFGWSARWWSYLVPPADHPLWGAAVIEFWNRRGTGLALLEHQQVSLSLSLIALSIVPLWRFSRGDRATVCARAAPVLAVLAAVALLCSLSPERTIGTLTFSRPSAWLYEIAPMFRAYARFGVVVGLMTSLLAGAGFAFLWRSGGWPRRAAAGLLAIAVLEYAPAPPWRSRDVLPSAAHRWIRAQTSPMRVLDCVETRRVTDTLATSLLGHEVSLLGGPGLDDCGEPRLGEKLRALGYTQVIVRHDTKAGAWLAKDSGRFANRGALSPLIGFDRSSIFSVPPHPPRAYLAAWTGFWPREYEGARTWRWMANVGTLRFVATPDTAEAILDIELRAFPGDRHVDWSVDGRPGGELEITPDWRAYRLRLGRMSAGKGTLTLSCREPAAIPGEVPGSPDPRALAVAIGAWTVTASRP